MRTATIILFLACTLFLPGSTLQAAVVIDRIAAVVDRYPIKVSDVERDINVTAFLNRQPAKLDAAAQKESAERLIDQQLIRREIAAGGYPRASDADAQALLGQIRHDRFADSTARLREELARYHLTEAGLQAQLLWQLTVLKFINDRFGTEAEASDNERGTQTTTSDARKATDGERTNRQFEAWLKDARERAAIQYHREALQ